MKLHIVRDVRDHNKLTVHLDVDLEKYCPEENKWKDSDLFDDDFEEHSFSDTPPFRLHLLQIKGVQIVSFDKYSIDIIKGEVFSWNILVEQIRASLELDLNDGNLARYSGAYRAAINPVRKLQKSFEKSSRV